MAHKLHLPFGSVVEQKDEAQTQRPGDQKLEEVRETRKLFIIDVVNWLLFAVIVRLFFVFLMRCHRIAMM